MNVQLLQPTLLNLKFVPVLIIHDIFISDAKHSDDSVALIISYVKYDTGTYTYKSCKMLNALSPEWTVPSSFKRTIL